MNELGANTGYFFLLLVLVLLLFLLMIAAIIIIVFLLQKQRRVIGDMQNDIWRTLEDMEDDLHQENHAQREELSAGMQRNSDNLMNVISSITQMQGEQVNSVLRQSQDNAQAMEMRQQAMQRITEESLRRLESSLGGSGDKTNALLLQNDQRMESLRLSVQEGLNRISDENSKRLDEMRRTVDEKLSSTLERRLSESFTQVSERLEQVYLSLGEMHSLASGVGDLKRMLGNVKTRGIWGEMQLGALLEQALTSTQYARNVAVVPGSNERVEFAVILPGKDERGRIYLPIDSKFPQEDYARLTEAAENGDTEKVEAARKGLVNALRTEAKRIGKYIAPPHTTDLAVMCRPLEGLYAEAMRNADLVEAVQREQRILIAGPSTLLALLNSLQMGFRTLAIEQRSAEVWKLLGAVKADFGYFATVLEKTQEKLRQATDTIDSAFVRTRSIEKKLRHVEALESGEAQRLLENETTPSVQQEE